MSKIINTDFKSNFAFQDGYMQQIESIVKRNAQHMITTRLASKIEDSQQSTDMVMQVDAGVTIAIRIRRPNCHFRDLTIRSQSWGNGKTELDKLREGWGDWYVYAWANTQGILDEWMLVNIHTMRNAGLLGKDKSERSNKDGRTAFVNYTIKELYDSSALTAAHLLREKRYWHHIINMEAGRVWEPTAYSIIAPAA